MAITFRGSKGSSLTHNELDQNFREFFYSASYAGSSLLLHKFTSVSSSVSIPLTNPVGRNGAIQFKFGSAVSGANAQFTGSQNLTFVENVLKVTGSILLDTQDESGIFEVTGSGKLTGNLVVGGTVTAEEFITERNTIIKIESSGSTTFGDSSNDLHERTGSLNTSGSQQLVGPFTHTGNYNLTGDVNSNGNIVHDGNIRITGTTKQTGSIQTDADITGSDLQLTDWTSVSSSLTTFLKNTTDTLTGDLNVTGTLTAQTYVVSSSVTYLTQSFASGSNVFGDSLDDIHEFTGSVNMTGSLNSTSVSSPIFTNTGNVILSASNHVEIKDSILRVNSFANTETGSYTFTNGDFYYNSNRNDFIGVIGGVHQSFGIEGAGMSNVSDDPTPELGGNLDLQGNNIYDTGTGNITIGGFVSGSSFKTSGHITGSALLINGAINATGDVTAFHSSDARLKDNITPIEGALEKIKTIGGYEFDWKSESDHEGHDIGVIAQEIEYILPELVVTRDNGYKAVRYEKIVALLIQAIKEQQSQIDDLKKGS